MKCRQRRRRHPRRDCVSPEGACWRQGWLSTARAVPSPNHGPRPTGAEVRLAVLHSISLPPGRYGGPAIEQLFTNQLDPAGHPSFAEVAALRVSAHFLIRRDGQVLQFVSVADRAWHAGLSRWRGVANRNDDSVGIELEGLEGRRFTAAQYRRTAWLLGRLCDAWPLTEVVGHEHIAPGRKRDPGPGWRWPRLARRLGGTPLQPTPAHATASALRALAGG